MNDLETKLPGTIKNGISDKRRPVLTILQKRHFERLTFLNSTFHQKNGKYLESGCAVIILH